MVGEGKDVREELGNANPAEIRDPTQLFLFVG